MHYSFSQSKFDKSVKPSLLVYHNSELERCHGVLNRRLTLEFIFLLFSLNPLVVLRCETVCLGFHWAFWKPCSLADIHQQYSNPLTRIW